MRMFLAPLKGTGFTQVVDLDPADYYWLDGIVDGTLVTTALVDDPIRPDVELVGPASATLFDRKGGTFDRFLVLDSRDAPPPANCEDLGDPVTQEGWDTPLSQPATNKVEDSLGQPRSTFQGWTIRQILVWAVEGDSWSQTVGGFTVDLTGGV